MEPSIYKNFKFGNIQVKYLYQGLTLVWPPRSSEYDGDPTTGYDSSLISFSDTSWGYNYEYLVTGELPIGFSPGGEDASLWYEFNGYSLKPSNVKIGWGTFDDGTSGFTILMEQPGPLDGSIYMYGSVTENSNALGLSPGLLVKTIESGSFTNSGITQHTTPTVGSGTATEELTVPGLFRRVSFKSDNLFFINSGYSSMSIPTQTIYPKDSSNAAITDLIIPSNVTSIMDHMFYNNTDLKKLDIKGPRVSTIPDYCCSYCTSLTAVKLPSSIRQLGVQAFYNCTSLNNITSDAITPPTCGSGCFDNVGNNGFIIIDADASTSAWKTWYTANGLKAKNWTIIQEDVPIDSSTYSSNQIITYVTSDRKEVFSNESEYTGRNIIFHSYNKTTNIGTLIYGSTITSLPQRGGGFENTKLVSINLPNTVTSIANSMFYNCIDLKKFIAPSGVTSLGSTVFRKCTSLISVDLSSSHITDIYNGTFRDCYSLKYVIFPSSLTAIHNAPFTGGHALEYLRFLGSTPPTLTDYSGEPDTPQYSAFYDTGYMKDGVMFYPPIYVPNVTVYKNYSNEWNYWYTQGRLVQG